MDLALPNFQGAIISQTAFITGESSFEWSTGGGIIGLGGDPGIAESVQKIIEMAQSFLSLTSNATNHDMPEVGKVFFYFLTTSGTKFFACDCEKLVQHNETFALIFSRFAWIQERGNELQAQFQPKKVL